MRRSTIHALLTLVALTGVVVTAGAATRPFPETIPLPNGFQPEGIAIGPGTTFYVGSIPTGAVYRGNLRTGAGSVLVPGRAGRAAIGVDVDHRRRLFVAGGNTGRGFVYDGRSGADIDDFQFTTGSTFVNDVVVTRTAAWFTDSNSLVLYRVPIGRGGALGEAQRVTLTGEIKLESGFNVNGIDATPNGRTLVIVQSNTGRLFTVNPRTGVTRDIDLGGGDVRNGDGILLDGRRLYVVQNRDNRVAVVLLAPNLSSGRIVRHLTDPDLDVPTTIDEFGRWLYAVNARFSTTPTPTTAYQVVQLRK